MNIALAETHAWLTSAVIGLNLCPFAKLPLTAGRVRFVVSAADRPEALLAELEAEIRRLADTDGAEVETTLLIHPEVLRDFLDYNDFLDVADAALDALGLTGVLQIASFHPDYRFAGTDADDIGNATNRSPYPTLQLLREASVERAMASFIGSGAGANPDSIAGPNVKARSGPTTSANTGANTKAGADAGAGAGADAIVDANLRTLAALGASGWAALQARCRDDASGRRPDPSGEAGRTP